MTEDSPGARRAWAPSATTAATAATAAATVATAAARAAARKRTAAAPWLAVLPMLAILAAACHSPTSASAPATAGASRPPTGAPATSAPSPAGNPTAAAGGAGDAAGHCPSAALKAALGPPSGAAGSSYVPIRFTNVSATRCTLFGYPGVSFVTGRSGSEVGNPASRIPLPTGRDHRVTLAPGHAANAVLQVADAGNYPAARCQPASAPYLRVFPPDQTAALYLRNADGYPACASRGVTILHVQPVQPGAGSAGS